MKKNIAFVFCMFFSVTAFCQPAGQVVIHGQLNGDLKGYNRMYLYTRTSNDSAEIVNGNYTFRFPFTEPLMKFFYPQYTKEMRQMYQPFGILISGPGDYYVTSDIKKPMKYSSLKGPQPMLELQNFNSDFDLAIRKMNTIKAHIYGDQWYQINEASPLYPAMLHSTDSLNDILVLPLIKKYVSENPKSIGSAYILSTHGKDYGTLDQKESLLHLLDAVTRKSKPSMEFENYILGLKKSRIGSVVSNFTLETPEKKSIAFDHFAGKYVLIDFWASWCWPCRNAFPGMRKMKQHYQDKNFEIYSISIDEDKDAWLKAVKDENNPWPQSWDGNGIANKYFAVTSIPATFLIDPKGKIIAKEVGYDPEGNDSISKELKKIFGE